MQKTVLSTIGAMLISHQVCAEPLALDPVEIAVGPEPQAASAAPRWDALNSEIVVKRDSTGVKSLSHEGLTGHHVDVDIAYKRVRIPTNPWFDGMTDLRLFSPAIFGAIDIENRTSSFAHAQMQMAHSDHGTYGQVGLDSQHNYTFDIGHDAPDLLFRAWGARQMNRFAYQNGTRKADFEERENKAGAAAGFSKSWDHWGMDVLVTGGYREAAGGGVVEYPSASRDAMNRALNLLSGAAVYHAGVSMGDWIYQPALSISHTLNYQHYSNPAPLVGRATDQTSADNRVFVRFDNDWFGRYPFGLSFEYMHQSFDDLSENKSLNDASEDCIRAAARTDVPLYLGVHEIDLSADAGVDVSIDNDWEPTAGLSIGYTYPEIFSVKASVRYMMRRPGYAEKYYISEGVRGDRSLKPEEGVHSDAVFGLDLSEIAGLQTLKIEGKAFVYYYMRSIHWTPVTSYLTVAKNLSDVTGAGGTIKLTAGIRIEELDVVWRGGYTYTKAETDGYDIPFVFRHRFDTSLSVSFKPLSVGLRYQLYRHAYDGFSKTARMADRHLLDLSIGYRYRALMVELYFQNMLDDRTMYDSRQRPLPGFVSGGWVKFQL